MRTRFWAGGLAALAVPAVLGWFFLLRSTSSVGSASSAPSARGHDVPAARASLLLTAEIPAARGALSIRGRVLGPAGPISGAVVVASPETGEDVLSAMSCSVAHACDERLLRCGSSAAKVKIVELVLERRGEAPPLARAVSGEDGSFELAGLEGRAFALWAEIPGKLIGVRRGVKAGSEDADVEIGPGMKIGGVVVDEDDKPLVGASLTAVFLEHSRFFDALSGADGSFSIGPVPLGELQVVANAPGLLPVSEPAKTSHRELGRVLLSRPRALGGTVQQDDAPVAGAKVRLESREKEVEATTGADGAFLFGGLSPGSYDLAATKLLDQARVRVTLESGGKDVLDVALDLTAGGEIAGLVRSEDGSPIANARLWTWNRQGLPRVDTETDAAGAYRLAALPKGSYLVAAAADHFQTKEDRLADVAPGRTATLDWVLKPASPLAGVVVDEEGRPVEGAEIGVSEITANQIVHLGHRNATTGEDGSFFIDRLGPGPYSALVHHRAYVGLQSQVEVPNASVRWVLSRGLLLSGVVVDEQGQPVAGARVDSWPARESMDRDRSNSQDATGPRGEFRLRGLEPGPHLVMASLGEGEYPRRASLEIDLRPASTGPVRLQFAQGLSISGTVVTPSGGPVPDAHVYASREGKADGPEDLAAGADATSRADGTFVLRHLRPGTYRLQASTEHASTAYGEAPLRQAGAAAVQVVVRPEAAVQGRVVRESLEPVTHFRVCDREFRDPQGAFRLPRDGFCHDVLVVEAEGFASTRRELGQGEQVVGDIVLTRGRTVTGKVLDSRTDAPLAGVRVDGGPPELLRQLDVRLSEDDGAAVTGADGTFTLQHVGAVPQALFASRSGYRFARQLLGADADVVTIRMTPGTTIHGTVTSAEGALVPAGWFMAYGSEGLLRAEVTLGRYRLEGVPPGRLTVRANFSGVRAQIPSRVVEVPESGELQVDFQENLSGVRVELALPEGFAPLLVPGAPPMPSQQADVLSLEFAALREESTSTGAVYPAVLPGAYTLFLHRQLGAKVLEISRQPLSVGPEHEQRTAVPAPQNLGRVALDQPIGLRD
ncbi:MAG TPA: carboxypeptidase regulatory-like domain-containing protein [Myxococcales bacterium]